MTRRTWPDRSGENRAKTLGQGDGERNPSHGTQTAGDVSVLGLSPWSWNIQLTAKLHPLLRTSIQTTGSSWVHSSLPVSSAPPSPRTCLQPGHKSGVRARPQD